MPNSFQRGVSVFEGMLRGERLERLRSDWLESVPNLAFVQIAEQGKAFNAAGFDSGRLEAPL